MSIRLSLRAVSSRLRAAYWAQKAAAFWNRRSHGAVALAFHASGVHGHCHGKKQRSGCGIMARCRPSGEQSAAMPAAVIL